MLTLSHAGFITALLDALQVPQGLRDGLLRFVRQKNTEGLLQYCAAKNLPEENATALSNLISLYGTLADNLPFLSDLCRNEKMEQAVKELSIVSDALGSISEGNNARLDFSVMNNMQYYDGLVFKGFVNGLPEGILSGGQYGGLLQKMGRKATAVGFAVYLNEVEYLP